MAQRYEPGSDLPFKHKSNFKSISKFYEKKQYKKALKACAVILKDYPNHGETLTMKGLLTNCTAEKKEQKEEAFELVKRGLRNNLMSYVSWHVLGLLHNSDGNYLEAMKCFVNAQKRDPENQTILRDLAITQIQLRELKGFAKTRACLLKLKPSRKDYWMSYVIAYHLLKDYKTALKVLESYENNIDPPPENERNIEWSEFYLYKCLLLEDAKDYTATIKTLDEKEKFILDKISIKEIKARCYKNLGQKDQQEQFYRELLETNSENIAYVKGLLNALNLDEKDADQEKLDNLFRELAEKYPKSSSLKLQPLIHLKAETEGFKSRLLNYIKPGLKKGVPQLFGTLKQLYSDGGKMEIIGSVAASLVDSLKSNGRFPGNVAPDQPKESPSTILWALYFKAQHLSKINKDAEALATIDEAIEHTPTVIDFYVFKAKALKRAGDKQLAAELLDFARSLDLADRWLNTKGTLYLLRADQTEKAEDVISLFARDPDTGSSNLTDMQCMWYEQEAGESFFRKKKHGPALKKFTAIEKHFREISDDQLFFHNYCLRKMTLSAYITLIRMEDQVFSHPNCFNACKSTIETYVDLYDQQKAKPETDEETLLAQMEVNERKKYLRKKNREEQRRKEQEEEAQRQREREAQKKRKALPRAEEDPLGEKLYKDKDLLAEATKFLATLQLHSAQQIGTHHAAFEVYFRKERVLLALRAILRAQKIDSEDPTTHVNLIRLLHSLKEKKIEGVVANVIESAIQNITASPADLLGLNQEFLARHGSSFKHRLAVARAYRVLGQENDEKIDKIIQESSTETTSLLLREALQLLDEIQHREAREAFRARAHARFPLNPEFANQSNLS